MKINIQRFGGRGASSSLVSKNLEGQQGQSRLYDLTDKYKGMNYLEFERRIRNRKNEYIGLYNDKGEIVFAGTSYSNSNVGVPNDLREATGLTHNHPIGKGREVGGTFSSADVFNHINLKLKTTRAVANEQGYVIQTNKGITKKQRENMLSTSLKANNYYNRVRKTTMNKALKKLKGISNKNLQYIELGVLTRYWRRKINGTNSGYSYIEIPRNKQ